MNEESSGNRFEGTSQMCTLYTVQRWASDGLRDCSQQLHFLVLVKAAHRLHRRPSRITFSSRNCRTVVLRATNFYSHSHTIINSPLFHELRDFNISTFCSLGFCIFLSKKKQGDYNFLMLKKRSDTGCNPSFVLV